MSRSHLKLRVDLVLLVAGALTFLPGLVLLVGFRMGPGAFRASALRAPRLVWLGVHRIAAVVLAAAMGLHRLGLGGRPFVRQLRNALAHGAPARAWSWPCTRRSRPSR